MTKSAMGEKQKIHNSGASDRLRRPKKQFCPEASLRKALRGILRQILRFVRKLPVNFEESRRGDSGEQSRQRTEPDAQQHEP